MPNLQNFPHLPLILPERAIYQRLGYDFQQTQLSATAAQQIKTWINAAFALCTPCGRALVVNLESNDGEKIQLANGIIWHSKNLAKNLFGATRVALLAATIGAKISEVAAEKLALSDGAAAVIYDAVGSEVAEAAITWVDQYVTRNSAGRSRFSVGYGDWQIAEQTTFMEALRLSEIGITLNPQQQMLPEKSVTAVRGIMVNR